MSFRIVPAPGTEPVLYLTTDALQGRPPGPAVIAHGARRLAARLVPITEPGRYLPATAALREALGLVDGADYRIRWAPGELRIGPVVAILAARRTADLPDPLARGFLLRYPDVGGLVYLCAADAIAPGAEWLDGYYWRPDLPGSEASWEKERPLAARGVAAARAEAPDLPPHPRSDRFAQMAGAFLEATPPGPAPVPQGEFVAGRFPLPGALWRRTGYLSREALDWLSSRLGPVIFNAHHFDKAEGFRLLAADPAAAAHLPETGPPGRWQPLLERDGAVVLKQQDGNSGYGLMRISRAEEGYRLELREGGRSETYPDLSALAARVEPVLSQSSYLAQQWIDLPTYQGRRVDFRVMMQKDDRGCWTARGILGRFGRPGSVVTNFVNAGYALPPDEALRRAFGVGWREAFSLGHDLRETAHTICRALDRSAGAYGDLGLDIGIDRQRRIWLFEVNKLPFHELPLYAGQEQIYLDVKSGPLLYAASLAGFGQ